MSNLRDQLQATLGDAYALDRELGGGGMSRVFVATDRSLQRQVVVKVLPPELAGGVNVDRFRREITTVAKLQHPHIVPVLSAGESGGLPYFTMPFVEGQSLRARLSHGELPLNEALGIMRDVCKALAYAHRNGVVHRDIKPDNVLLSGDSAMVTDFGVAKALSEASPDGTLTSIGVALGTPAYMAPEQAAASPGIDHRVDIYAFGAMAYEMIAGHSPFAGRSPQRQLAAHAVETPVTIETHRPSIAPALARLVMRCLEKSPADRPQSVDEVLQELNAIATPSGGMAPTAAEVRVQSGSGLLEHGRRSMAALVVVLLLLAIAIPQLVAYAKRPDLNPRRVAVAPFTNLTGDKSLDAIGRIASDWITSGLTELDSVDVISADAAAEAVGDSGNVVGTLAERARAGTVVSGSYFRQGDSLRISAQVTNAATGKVVQSLTPVTASVADPLPAITALRDRLMSEVAVTDDRERRRFSQPPTYAAYRELVAGTELFSKQNFRGAIPHFQRAIALDSNFITAIRGLAGTYFNLANYRAADSIARVLVARRGQLRGTDVLVADEMEARLNRNADRELEVYRKQAARDSSFTSIYLAGWGAVHVNRPAEAVRALEAIDYDKRAYDWPPYFNFLTIAHHLAGDHDAELKAALRGRRYHTRTSLVNYELRARAAKGDVKRVRFLVDSLATAQLDSSFTPAASMRTAAAELRAHGYAREAQELSERAVRWYYEDAQRQPPTAGRWRVIAAAHLDARELDSAKAIMERRIVIDTASMDPPGMLGLIAAYQGDTAKALRTVEWLGKVTNPYPDVSPKIWQARIYAQLGRKTEAVNELRRSLGRPVYFGLWIHTTREFEQLKGFPAFDELMRPKG